MTKRIFDCFTFFDELDLLELRLAEQYRHVDMFVVVEAPVTFQGAPKPLYFQENTARFQPFLDKITAIAVTDMPEARNAWDREHYQRNAIRRILDSAGPDDIIIVSDADELISRETLEFLRRNSGYFLLDMPMYQYFMNMCSEQERWTKPFAFTRALAGEVPDFNHVRTHQEQVLEQFGARGQRIENAGWHFTYLGGPEKIRNKLQAFSHTDGWHAAMLEEGGIEAQLSAGYNVGGTWHHCVYQPIDERFPAVVVENQQALIKAGYIRDPFAALRAMQVYARNLHHGSRSLQNQLNHLQRRYDRLAQQHEALKAELAKADKSGAIPCEGVVPTS